ncbi:MAG: CpaF family protein [Anaerolineae bacterium]|nr:CpaF family protein [Anaerolineae bacterium]
MNDKMIDLDIRLLNRVLAQLYLDLISADVHIGEALARLDAQLSIERPSAATLHQAAHKVVASGGLFDGEMRSRVLESVVVYCQQAFDNPAEEQQARIAKLLQTADLPSERQAQLAAFIYRNLFGWGPLAPLLDDNAVTEILVDGPDTIYVEKRGQLEDVSDHFLDVAQLMDCIRRIFASTGIRVDAANPIADNRLPDGSRANIVLPPVALNGPALTIRKFSMTPLTVEDLLRFGSWDQDMVEFIRACVIARCNIVVAGGTASGKTTLLNIVTGMIPADERVIAVERRMEMQPRHPEHLIRLESRPPNSEGQGEVTMRDLLLNALRMRPDRIILGESQGSGILEMLRAMNTGHDGGMLNLHATSPRDALARLEMMAMIDNPSLPLMNVRHELASAIDLILCQQQLTDGTRKLVNVTQVAGMQGNTIVLQNIFEYYQTGMVEGRVVGYHTATGVVPRFLTHFRDAGLDLPMRMFTPKQNAAGAG